MTTRRLMEELQAEVRGGGVFGRSAPARGVASLLPSARGDTGGSVRGGDASVVKQPAPRVQDPALLEQLKASTPAKVGVGRAGLRYRTQTLLQFLADFAVAKAAVESQVPEGWAEQQGWVALQTAAEDPDQFLARPDLGRRLSEASMSVVRERFARDPDVQIVVADGLSATASMQNAPPMVQALEPELARRGLSVGTVAFVRHCRAKIADVVGQAVGARVAMILIGERPGLGTGDGMSAYLVWQPHEERTDAEKQAISNIHRRGMLPEEAGRFAARLIEAILEQQTSGVTLDVSRIEVPKSGLSAPPAHPAGPQARTRINQAHPEPLAGCGQSHGQQCDRAQNGLPGAVCNRSDGRPCEATTY
jgi:ethanolamine ammonia-lyase small subunit